jgi:hypothetical protein
VAGYVQEAVKPAAGQVKSFDAFRRTMDSNFAKLDSNDIGAIWSVLRTVMQGNRPSDGQMADYRAAFTDLFGDVSNGCSVCPVPMGFPSGVGVALTVSTPTATANGIPVGGSVSFNLLQSTYLVNGRPQYVADYAVNAEATAAVRTLPEVSLGVAWIRGQLATNVLPLPSLGVAVSTPGATTQYGSYSGAGSVGLTMPEAVYMFLDKGERNKLLATLKNPAQGPNYVIGKANQAIRELKDMVMNYGLETGINVGMPGSLAFARPDGAMVMSVGGIIATF